MSNEIRVRFAPSPTGVLHIGGVRTALYNYLFAKKHGGKFILRIEDTDQTRFVEGAEQYIKDALAWCGIQIDEGTDQGGDYAPYKQSERKELYKKYAQQMLDEGTAYYAFDTAEELDKMREALKAAKANSLNYNSITRNTMKNSLTLSEEEVAQRLASGEPYVIRIKVPAKEDVRLNDMIRGWVNVHTSTMDDKVLMKSDGMPTYHLANVVDDYLMKITHVIRGEEWLPSAPLHVLLYRYLGWENSMPQFAHLPLLLKPDGNGKLSKRDAAKHGFPIFPMEWKATAEDAALKGFKEEGYLNTAFVNFLALLGWNPGTENEIFSLDELIEAFTIERVSKAGAKFDIDKAIWFNQQYIRNLAPSDLATMLLEQAQTASIKCDEQKALAIAELLQERIDFIPELISKGKYFFEAPSEYVEKVVRKKWDNTAKQVFEALAANMNGKNWNAEDFQNGLEQAVTALDTKVGMVMQILRVAITGEAGGPDLMRVMEVLGTNEVADRIKKATNAFDQAANNE
ncbi:glutamate--tRNA ligase [Reichenbachiella carrageenanivorans]|uniref:Glutamate--tRNA ligase n=1 Tax=Reichenbachiella carrageenanivorans TaxID=2979869 RepID=A0ABY6D3M0_9BACT|nr:glutamate--tRNA ligase [Reichenbachiella carrageenanivorans]UXX80746.1 glutamate--tRNA ligase [Reichenbachiella carrageenanivorans]